MQGIFLVAQHCENGSFQIKSIGFYQSYSPVAQAGSFRINIDIADMHRLTARILYVSNAIHNTKFPINERVCVSPPPYYIDWFERSYPNVPLNWDDDPFFIQFMNGIKETKPAVWEWNVLLDEVVTIIKYKKSKIYHAICIKGFSDGAVSYITVYTDDVLNITNNETEFI